MYIIQLNMNLAQNPNDAIRFGRKRSDMVCLAESLARQGSTRRKEWGENMYPLDLFSDWYSKVY